MSRILSLGRRLSPLVIALLAQLLAAALVFGAAVAMVAVAEVRFPPLALLALQGAVAALLGARFGLAKWWIPLHIALPPAAAAAMTLPVPAWVYTAGTPPRDLGHLSSQAEGIVKLMASIARPFQR